MLPKITHPLFDLEIPSSKKRVKARPMLVKEEKILLMAKTSGQYSDILNSVKQVVNNCVVDKNFDINKIALFDLEYLFLKIRAFSVDNVSKASYRDGEDNEVYDFEIPLDQVEVKFPEKEVNKTVMINDEFSLILKYPDASLYSDKNFRGDAGADIELMVMKTIDKIVNGDEMIQPDFESPENVAEFVNDLPVKAYTEIQEFWRNLPSLYYKLEYKNKLGNDSVI
jgi:hypothetical protein